MREAGITVSNARDREARRTFSTPLTRVDDQGRVKVYIEVTDTEISTIASIESAGRAEIQIVNSDLNLIQALIPHDGLEAVAALQAVTRIRTPSYGFTRTGTVTSEGDVIHNADDVRALPGPTGSGVKVGIISDGSDGWPTAAGTGDLPAIITPFGTSNGGEGTSIGEIIHDLAPDAELAIGGAFNAVDPLSTVEFLSRVTDLKTWGADVIVDDVGFLEEPFFSDGPVAASYATALSEGVVMVSAAGNDAERHYQGTYVSGLLGDPDCAPRNWPCDRHEFSSGDQRLDLSMTAGDALLVLQWSNPFGSASDDYDLCTMPDGIDFNPPADPNLMINCSLRNQIGTPTEMFPRFPDPVEVLGLNCTPNFGSDTCSGIHAKILRFCPGGCTSSIEPTPQILELFLIGPIELVEADEEIEADSVFGHPAVPGVISTAAINADDPGNDDIASYSSRGPSTICSSFPCTSPVLRPTPAITGIDNVTVSPAGISSPFAGTSASAPHLAAIAALMLEADPTLTPAEVLAALQSTAADRGTAGFDNTYGAGLANALAAVNLVTPSPPDLIVNALTGPATGTIGDSITVSATVENQGVGAAGAFDLAFYFSTDGVFDAGDTPSATTCSYAGLAASTADSATCSSVAIGVPGTFISGTYTLFAKVDDLDTVGESDETNNTRAADSGTITFSQGDKSHDAAFVEAQYVDLLHRAPDLGGFAFWLAFLQSNPSDRPTLSFSILNSGEFINSGLFIVQAYRAVLVRNPDFPGWLFWYGHLQSGLTPLQLMDILLASGEYAATFGTPTNEAFVELVYQNVLGRAADAGGLAFWTNLLDLGAVTRAEMIVSFLGSAEFQGQERYEEFVSTLYLGFLRRTPDAPGLAFWVSLLQGGTSRLDVINAFIGSPEYCNRF